MKIDREDRDAAGVLPAKDDYRFGRIVGKSQETTYEQERDTSENLIGQKALF